MSWNPIFLDRRLKEPDFKIIKSFTAEFTNAEKQLTSIKYIKHKEKKMKSRLILEALVLSCDPAKEETISVKHTT
jgi:hypothetical protein